jgi:hypothetical protein
MELCGGFIRCVPGRMLVNPGDVGLALDRQYGTPLAFFLSSVFLACREGLGKRRNIPSGETANTRPGLRALAAQRARVVADLLSLSTEEGAGKTGCRLAPVAPCASKLHKNAQGNDHR